ncbi:hypothetical protein KUTeg_016424 [Tegillarca granosa]|uniref:Peptidase M12A domain-containing protein n=1 Tax=Tegillarca granosa TaxID=220873 RepID=A0ABQ9ELS2_TEGGR|nr:hypothetical protein KUTeg_016424 [Tegillarca granosa]
MLSSREHTVLYLTDEEMKLGRLRAQQRYEYWTCIRFVPWTSKTSSKYDLDHNNYLKHVDDDGCWAIMGNTKGDGQRISCCDDGHQDS